jgi:hypothetical protein
MRQKFKTDKSLEENVMKRPVVLKRMDQRRDRRLLTVCIEAAVMGAFVLLLVYGVPLVLAPWMGFE